jgi:hypothetical protein
MTETYQERIARAHTEGLCYEVLRAIAPHVPASIELAQLCTTTVLLCLIEQANYFCEREIPVLRLGRIVESIMTSSPASRPALPLDDTASAEGGVL